MHLLGVWREIVPVDRGDGAVVLGDAAASPGEDGDQFRGIGWRSENGDCMNAGGVLFLPRFFFFFFARLNRSTNFGRDGRRLLRQVLFFLRHSVWTGDGASGREIMRLLGPNCRFGGCHFTQVGFIDSRSFLSRLASNFALIDCMNLALIAHLRLC